MPTATAITINDSVPTARVFSPVESNAAKTILLDRDTNLTSAGSGVMQLGFSPTRPSRPTDKVNGRLTIPTEQTVDSVTRVSHSAIFAFNATLPEQMTVLERADLTALAVNMVTHALVQAYTKDLDPLY